MFEKQTFYEVLQVPQNATLKEIKLAYHKMAMKWIYKLKKGENIALCYLKMRGINEAFLVLGTIESRTRYDVFLDERNQSKNSNSVEKRVIFESLPDYLEATIGYLAIYENLIKFNNGFPGEFLDFLKWDGHSKTIDGIDKIYSNIIDFNSLEIEFFNNWLSSFAFEFVELFCDGYKKTDLYFGYEDVHEDDLVKRLDKDFKTIIHNEIRLSKKKARH